MDKSLLVGIDCSECSQRALDFAAEWARSTGSRLLVAHIIEWSPFSFNTPMENEVRHKRREDELGRARKEIVDPVVDKLLAAGVKAEGLIRHGRIAETISQLAEETGASHVIVGRTGTSRIKSHLFGSVPGMLVQIADQPVTVVP